MPRIIYSPKYNIGFFGLERLHPFDTRKYGRAWKVVRQHFGSEAKQFLVRPKRQASREELLLVHSEDFLERLRDPKYVARAIEVPPAAKLPAWVIDRQVLRPMRWATRGTIVAAEESIKHGLAVNLSGGYHHAKPSQAEGFSIYSDVGIATASLQLTGAISQTDRIVYIDTDAHQGNGISHVFLNDNRVFIFDVFNHKIYPAYDVEARNRIDCEIPISSSTTDAEYMTELETRLPGFLDSVANSKIGIAFYNAGTDVYSQDPVGLLTISAETILKRDLFVVSELRKRGIPTVMVLSGGYTKKSYQFVADSVIQLIEQENTLAN